MTAAAIDSSSSVPPPTPPPEKTPTPRVREAAMTPASAAMPPAMAKAAILMRGTLTPARRAASSLLPTA